VKSPTSHYLYILLSQIFSTYLTHYRNSKWSSYLHSLHPQTTQFWKITRYFAKTPITIPPLTHQGEQVYLTSQKAEVLAHQFVRSNHLTLTLGSSCHSAKITRFVDKFFQESSPSTPSLQFTTTYEVKHRISLLKSKSAPGTDGITPSMLRNLSHKALNHLTHLLNHLLRLGHFPALWKTAIVIPIPKPNKPSNDPNSYRPISLLSNLAKLFERILAARLTSFVLQHQLLPHTQFGFRKKHSTVAQLARIAEYVTDGFNRHKHTGMILLDIEKAYDTV